MLLSLFSGCFPVGRHPGFRLGPQLAPLVSLCHLAQIRNGSLSQDILILFLENHLNMMILLDQDTLLPSARKLS